MSGQTNDELEVSTYLQVEGSSKAKDIDIQDLVSPRTYAEAYKRDPELENKLEEELMNFFRNYIIT